MVHKGVKYVHMVSGISHYTLPMNRGHIWYFGKIWSLKTEGKSGKIHFLLFMKMTLKFFKSNLQENEELPSLNQSLSSIQGLEVAAI